MDYNLCCSFGGAHDTDRVNCFVCGDQQEALGLVAVSCFCYVLGAEDVILDGFFPIAFHEWYVLVGGGVENYCGFVCSKDLVDMVGMTYICYYRNKF